jgi:hypothetical protein
MKKIELDVPKEILIRDYLILNSSYKVAKKYNTSATAVKRILKESGVLRTQNEAASIRNNTTLKGIVGKYTRTKAHKKALSEFAKTRTNKRNPSYKNGKYVNRPKRIKSNEATAFRNFVFNRDKHTCLYCKTKGGHLHAHHILPYWVCPKAFYDTDNAITVCSSCHFKKAHLGNWHKFDYTLINAVLLEKYSLDGERLNELATFEYKK